MMTKAGGHIHIGITVMNEVETPEEFVFVHDQVYEPAAEVERQYTDEYGNEGTGVEPIDQSELIGQAPVGEFYDQYGQSGMQDEVYYGKYEVHTGMAEFVLFVPHGQQGDGSFDDPEEEESAHEYGQSFKRPFFEVLEMINYIGPHSNRFRGKDTKENGVFPAAGSSGPDNLPVPWVVVKSIVMAGTFSQMYIQVVFAVRGRACLLHKSWRNEVFKYISGIISAKNHKPIIVNGVGDHVHVFIGMKPSMSVSDLVRDIKNNSSKFINEKRWLPGKFSWQEGFSAFTYSQEHVERVYHYILNQEEHHRKVTFREEYMKLLNEFCVEYKEQYLFEWIDDPEE